jgi:glucosamine kinase
MMRIVAGVDGGGSHTRVILADEEGREIGRSDGPPSAIRPGDGGRSPAIIARMVRDALRLAGQAEARAAALCAGVAGAGRDAERDALARALVDAGVADDVMVHPDAAIGLEDAFGEGPGILLLAGTGSVAFGRSPTGTIARTGGWGPVIGDEGGGTWIGRRALAIVAAAADGREPETALTGAILTATEVSRAEDLIAWASGASPADLAALAPAVLRCADTGDRRATTIVSFAAEELVLHVRTIARELFGDERAAIPLAVAGGLLGRGSPLRSALEHRFKSAVPGAQFDGREIEPARGAVRLALRLLGAAGTGA